MTPSSSCCPWLVPAVLGIALLVSCSGCDERSPPPAPVPSMPVDAHELEPSSALQEDEPDTIAPLDEAWDSGMEVISLDGRALEVGPAIDQPSTTYLLPLAGKVDETNRYLSAVWLQVEFTEGPRGFCSGSIIGQNLVLTAGHCVCQRKPASTEPSSRDVIDSSTCAKTATVITTVYGPFEDTKEKIASIRTSYSGGVHPHPDLHIILDAQGRVVSSKADLALVILDEPLEKRFQPIPLSDRDIQLNESIVIVGSGYDETTRVYDGERRSSTNKVVETLSSGEGRMRIRQPEGHHYRGDSGGPCLREGPRGAVLVGISARNLGEGEAITSTYSYRDWLRSQIQRAKATGSTRPK